ncbi:MAG: hypothetical protein IT337_09665, partial [Thermomicrobiales bacterium]|nr:hypothetical protein [Thermomicrobiales bacterium]
MHRIVVVIVAALVALAGFAPIGVTAVVLTPPIVADRAADAADFARLLSRLEADRDWPTIAALMHPDSQDVIPARAVVGWYESEFASKTTAELTVTDVQFEDWTWGVTGRRYEEAASVAFVQPYWTDGVRSDVSGTLHLVRHDGGWGWFFGASSDFVAGEIARYAPGGMGGLGTDTTGIVARAARFPDPLHAHIDAYWAARFAEAGRSYVPPRGVVGFSEPMPTGCGSADPRTETAFYCVLDR